MGCDTTALTEARAQLKSLLAPWPDLDAGAQASLGRLPWRARRAVVLVYGEGLTQQEAARRLGIGERISLVRSRCSRKGLLTRLWASSQSIAARSTPSVAATSWAPRSARR